MSNLWTKVVISTTAENIEPVCGALISIGIDAVEIDDPTENLRFLQDESAINWDYLDDDLPTDGVPTVRFYLSPDENRWSDAEITAAIGALGSVSFERVKDDWTDAWLEFYKPLKIGNRIVIRPFWEEYEATANEIVFTIDPGHVFGTGQHQSTEMCLCLLDKYIAANMQVLDLGCGSGILAIISLLLGAKHVVAIDIDPAAAKMMGINAELNGIPKEQYSAICGNVISDSGLINGQFDLIVANIVADVIIPLAPIAAGFIKSNGLFITSGIIDDRQEEVIAALKAQNFEIVEVMTKDNWVAICAKA